MKKCLLTLSALFYLLQLAQAQVVVTEIMYNPPESNTDSLEYIEIYNNTNAAIDISGWSFTQGAPFTFPAGTSMPSHAYFVIARNPAPVQTLFGISNVFAWNTGEALTNGGEDIELRDAASNVIDYVDYKNVAPWPTDPAGGGSSLVLCDYNSDNSLPISWQAATTPVNGLIINGKQVFANPGAASGCTGTVALSATNDIVVVSSGESKTIDVLFNDLLPNPVTSFTILTAPAHGTAAIANQQITYNSTSGYCGTDKITYIVCDATKCDTADVNITVKCYPTYTIAQVTGETATGTPDSNGVSCALTGVVYGINLRPLNNSQPSLLFTLIDASGNGIAVSSLAGNFGYTVQEKDKITVRGVINQFNGLTEIDPESIVKVSENNALLAPLPVIVPTEETESKLIKINNLHFVDAAQWTTGSGSSGFNVFVVSNDHPLDTILLRIDRDAADLYNSPVPPEPFNVTGLGGQFDSSTPFNTGYQIIPRYIQDISTLVATHEADFSANVRLTPNPVQDVLHFSADQQFDRLTVYNLMGQPLHVINTPAQQEEISVRDLPTGIYMVRIEKDGAAWMTRFVK